MELLVQKTKSLPADEHDVIWGAAEIAAVLNLTPTQAWYLLERRKLPARKVGKKWCASRRQLLRAVGAEVT
jgi:hypothetical protein